MLAKDFKDKFLNTYYSEKDNNYVTEIYDKWKRTSPQILRISSSKDEAIENHKKICKDLLKKIPLIAGD